MLFCNRAGYAVRPCHFSHSSHHWRWMMEISICRQNWRRDGKVIDHSGWSFLVSNIYFFWWNLVSNITWIGMVHCMRSTAPITFFRFRKSRHRFTPGSYSVHCLFVGMWVRNRATWYRPWQRFIGICGTLLLAIKLLEELSRELEAQKYLLAVESGQLDVLARILMRWSGQEHRGMLTVLPPLRKRELMDWVGSINGQVW